MLLENPTAVSTLVNRKTDELSNPAGITTDISSVTYQDPFHFVKIFVSLIGQILNTKKQDINNIKEATMLVSTKFYKNVVHIRIFAFKRP